MKSLTDVEARKLALEAARMAGVKCPSTSALTMLVRLVEAAVLTKQSEACIKQARDEALEEAAKLCEKDGLGTKYQGDVYAAAIREMATEMK